MTSPTRTAQPASTATDPAATGMSSTRKIALAGGVIYLVTFAASLPQLTLFADVVADPAGYFTSPGSAVLVQVGSWLEVVTAAACVGTAVALYPITRRVSRTAAIGFVTSRVLEAAMILVGVMSILALLTLRADLAGATGAEATAATVTAEALVSLRQWTFLLGPGLIPGVNALFLGYVMYRSRLVPRIIPTIGLVGAPIILTSATVTILGGWAQTSSGAALCALPIVVWEFSLGMWLTVKGFRRTPLTEAMDAEAHVQGHVA